MRISLVIFLSLCFLSCSPRLSLPADQGSPNKSNSLIKAHFDNWYDSYLEEGESKKTSDYISIISRKEDGNYVKRVFFPDTKTMTHYNEYKDRLMTIKHGPEKVFSDQGMLTYEGQYSDGKELGLFRRFDYSTGKLVAEGNYRDGEKEGLWKFYDSDGVLQRETKFKKGLMEGETISYSEDGEITAKIDYRADTIYNSKIVSGKHEAFKVVQEMPLFGDGCPELKTMKERKACAQNNMLQTMYKNLRYPPNAREYGLEGMAIVRFVVDETGGIKDILVIRGLSQEITDEVLRVVNLLDTWVPGTEDGEPVSVMYTLPFKFRLE